MTEPSALDRILEARGFTPRKEQVALFEHLIQADNRGVIAQAGTGVGKSLAILAAATHLHQQTGQQSIIVTPTLALMDQYVTSDLPAARDAFGDLEYTELRGADHYHCEMTASLYVMGEPYPGGCGGADFGCSRKGWMENGYRCDYRFAREEAMSASVIVTNTAMLMVNDFILATIATEDRMHPLSIEPDSALFVDEAHMLEPKIRDWYSRSMWHMDLKRYKSTDDETNEMAHRLGEWIEHQKPGALDLARIPPAVPVALEKIALSLPVKQTKKTEGLRDAAGRLHKSITEPNPSV